jgi:hypothetical protein
MGGMGGVKGVVEILDSSKLGERWFNPE